MTATPHGHIFPSKRYSQRIPIVGTVGHTVESY